MTPLWWNTVGPLLKQGARALVEVAYGVRERFLSRRSVQCSRIWFPVSATVSKASSTLCQINLKTQLWERKRNKCSASTLERFRWWFTFKISKYNIFFAMLITWEDKLHDKMTSAYSKSCGYKKFSVHTNTKKYRFQIVPLWRAFSKSSVYVDLFMRISV